MKDKLEINVIIEDGVCMAVLGNRAALDADIDINVVLFDPDQDDGTVLDKRYYGDDNLHDIPYTIDHCSTDDEDEE